MKELEKTKRISIASTLFILVLLIGFLTYERPKNTFTLNTKSTLQAVTKTNYFASLNDIQNSNIVLLDTRSEYEYNKGHLNNAINMSAPDILSEENQEILKRIDASNKTLILYAENPEQVNIPFLILYQLGFNTIKLLPIEITYHQNKLITTEVSIEAAHQNINAFIAQSNTNVTSSLKTPKK
ncbi:rhodanese-like domain-containing protein [Tamlana fucoidanivorans]|uniref:Rhodanese-like domain-containing protein n=1 Tax=Allotamlana fucoidanivorans TaxID=2583814 RepID=A0A5C4SGW1_9FLAO|nr:rhodanese-like domain-containing protein [Tamlana fucoidanivorans]TNJ42938.1 rhodanese-like domain-containing protein [Tamlana fucoidanivorans]